MTNDEIMKLTLKRANILDIKLAIKLVIIDFQAEIKDSETREARKKIASNCIEHRWKPLLETIEQQFKEQDN